MQAIGYDIESPYTYTADLETPYMTMIYCGSQEKILIAN